MLFTVIVPDIPYWCMSEFNKDFSNIYSNNTLLPTNNMTAANKGRQ